MRLHRLLGEEEALADLAVHEAVGDQLEHFDLAVRGLLLELAHRRRECDDVTIGAATPLSDLLEATGVVHIPAQDLFALCGVHGLGIDVPAGAL